MKKKKNKIGELLELFNLISGEDIIVDTSEPEENIRDYLNRENVVRTLMREVQHHNISEDGSFLDYVMKSMRRRKGACSEDAAFWGAIRAATSYLSKLFTDVCNHDNEAVEALNELIGIDIDWNDFKETNQLDSVKLSLTNSKEGHLFLYDKESLTVRGSECWLVLSSKALKKKWAGKKGGLDGKTYIFYDASVFALKALFEQILRVRNSDPNRRLYIDAIFKRSYDEWNSMNSLSRRKHSIVKLFMENAEIDDSINGLLEMSTLDIVVIGRVYSYFLREYETDRNYAVYRNVCAHTARAFETKKNIPLQTIKKMKESRFNEYFGYVEFDEKTILENSDEVYKDFAAINKEFFGDLKTPDVQIRFRLLGRHKAQGLYYPGLSCICVDIRYPDSLIHEYFHMYDYKHGELSASFDFSELRQKYEYLLTKWYSNASDTEKTRLKGKYNLNYYLTPTEIFARCGEIYVSRIKGVKNSCVKPDENLSFAYPKDEELERLINEYFDKLLDCSKEQDLACVAGV